MRHLNKNKKLGKDSKHRLSILRNLGRALVSRERVFTTLTKAKQLRSFVEKLITRAKKDTLHNRRLVYKDLPDAKLLVKLFDDIAKRYLERPGGYTRLIKVGMRKGDGSEMCYLELTPQLLKETDTPSETSSKNNPKKDSAESHTTTPKKSAPSSKSKDLVNS